LLKIIFGAGNTIQYIYNASGQKLEKIVQEGATTSTTNYLNGFQYKDNVLEFFPTAEGYVQNENGVLGYVFQYKDHLGNVRVSYKRNAQNVLEIVEENNYYPFGMLHKGYNHYVPGIVKNKKGYNGKELQDELGLNMYAMDLRQYDPAIGRWVVHDPIVHNSQSPYSAFNGNPIYWADPSGMSGEHYDWDTGKYVDDKGTQVSFETALASVVGKGGKESENKESESNENSETSNENNIKFPKGSDYEKTRPRFTKVVKQLKNYVKSNPTILDMLSRYSGFSTIEVLQELEYGRGGTLLTEVIDAEYGTTPPGGGVMKVNLKWANGLEIVKNNERLQATSFLVAITILHEFVHYGMMKNNLSEGIYKYGDGFEQKIFSPYEMISKENAYKLLEKYGKGWNFKD